MGAYFTVVNPARRQYLDPSRFGEGIKFFPVLLGDHCIHALKLLIADCFRRDDTSFCGAWLGDPVILASDDYGLPNPGGVATGTADMPDRNLSAAAEAEFIDISYRALAELCDDPLIMGELVIKAKEDECFLADLGATLVQYRPPALEAALNDAAGPRWRDVYQSKQLKQFCWRPLPLVVWPL